MVGALLLHLGYIASHTFGHEHINFEVFEVGSLISWVIVLLLIFQPTQTCGQSFIGLLPMASVILLITAMSNRYVP